MRMDKESSLVTGTFYDFGKECKSCYYGNSEGLKGTEREFLTRAGTKENGLIIVKTIPQMYIKSKKKIIELSPDAETFEHFCYEEHEKDLYEMYDSFLRHAEVMDKISNLFKNIYKRGNK